MIYLKDIFNFDELLKQYQNKEIKLRFNTSWTDKETKKYYDFVEMYTTKSKDFLPYILSIGSNGRKRNKINDLQFQFIEVESHKWLFVGAYEIISTMSETHTNKDGITFNYAQAKRIEMYDKYIERLIVDWTNKPQSFFYNSREIIDEVKVLEINHKPYFELESEFPGYENLSESYEVLKMHWNNKSWKDHLSSVYGVYVITDTKNGKLYIGSAYGNLGVYGRWDAYLKDGYDKDEIEDINYPNVRLKALVQREGMNYIKDNFRYTLLEIFPKNEIGKQQALNREKYWKKALYSRAFGYNNN